MNEALPIHVSECSLARPDLAKFCEPHCLEIGFGGDATVDYAVTFDLPQKYTTVGRIPQMVRGDCRNVQMFCDQSFQSIVSHHVLEDFYYRELIPIVREWRRVLRVGGYLVTNCPDQQKFLAHCAKTGQGINLAHKEQDFSLDNFRRHIVANTGPWKEVFVKPEAGPYSWYLVLQKV